MITQEYNTNTEIKSTDRLNDLKNSIPSLETPSVGEFRSNLQELLNSANEVKELNPEALVAATSEQKTSVESIKIEYFRLNIKELRAKLVEVTQSNIANKEIRIEALNQLIAENEEVLEQSKPKTGFFNSILNFRRNS
jgi:hypothetical protein